ncbi:hypothetical protein EW026_g2541 [Hermanssonia centrifuga]|uniref:Glycosyltransferase family 32 protein n=1 Tax=Hermanssonia centrifuga TaxID=98765 RepID=A0A4S4KMZ3_9APHY|nr:hypothetical protein EW026_g2541 [Hermanssonia centrifuga]
MEGSITDMDVVMKHCDYSAGKYVRDCLKILRLGAGLDVSPRKSSPSVSGDVRYIYTEGARGDIPQSDDNVQDQGDKGLDGLMSRWGKHYEPHLQLPDPHGYFSQNRPYTSCGDERPIFHMFWKGAFTDKPYMALLSFLYTQNLGLHLDDEKEHTDAAKCRPQLWLWIDRGALNGVRQSMAERQLLEELSSNPWAAPFLHYRFRDVFQFKFWDLREQLDSVAELKDEWRIYGKYLGAREEVGTTGEDTNGPGTQTEPTLGSLHDTSYLIARTSHAARASVQYDKPSVALSDLVRFVLCHRFGGVYLDVDTLFLRDWEDLWGWRGAFAYRWSRMDRYNTAVLRMHKGSAFGTFILRTALRNGLDFHPIRITRYLKDAQMENLLLRVPDALFDPAWLASEGYQTERPPFPFFSSFNDFFDTPSQASAAPDALGFDGFFRGAYIYHYHNNWWTPFDPHRDFPDLGPRFAQDVKTSSAPQEEISDLSWSAVLKRTFEGYIRGEQPNMYGEWLVW